MYKYISKILKLIFNKKFIISGDSCTNIIGNNNTIDDEASCYMRYHDKANEKISLFNENLKKFSEDYKNMEKFNLLYDSFLVAIKAIDSYKTILMASNNPKIESEIIYFYEKDVLFLLHNAINLNMLINKFNINSNKISHIYFDSFIAQNKYNNSVLKKYELYYKKLKNT
ncbi:MAG: hypothetical protein ACRDCW_12225 [Sarcina sp.]